VAKGSSVVMARSRGNGRVDRNRLARVVEVCAAQGPPPLISLDTSFRQLRATFDESADKLRIVALLSPTCPVCIQGAAQLEAILEERPALRVRLLIVWEPVRVTDLGPCRRASRHAEF
jgi:hypothetical protein